MDGKESVKNLVFKLGNEVIRNKHLLKMTAEEFN
jgi:hypothetical protein